MIATNTVKINGITYRAGQELPALDSIANKAKITKPMEKALDKAVEKVIETPKALQETEIERLAREEKVKIDIPKYKKSDLTKLTTAEVKDLAQRLKIDGYEEMSGNALKRLIYEMSVDNYAED